MPSAFCLFNESLELLAVSQWPRASVKLALGQLAPVSKNFRAAPVIVWKYGANTPIPTKTEALTAFTIFNTLNSMSYAINSPVFWTMCFLPHPSHPKPPKKCNPLCMQNTKLVYSAREVCEVLGISRSSFNKLRKLGVFKSLPFLRRNELYNRQQVFDYVNGQTPKRDN